MPDNDDKKVKELIDTATRADLERWFSLPSFQQLADLNKPPPEPLENPDIAAVRKRRAEATAAIDPALVEAHRKRTDPPEDLIRFKALIDVCVDPSIARFDAAMIDRQHTIAEPREVEIPPLLYDDLKEATPQALLRDLHRPVRWYDKTFEFSDPLGELRVDIPAVVAEALVSHKVELPGSPYQKACAVVEEIRDQRRRPWTGLLPLLRNRRVKE